MIGWLQDKRAQCIIAFFLLLIVVVSVVGDYIRAWQFTTDDAYITVRYAQHLAEGHGIVWNIGEAPLEGYSNFLFVLLGAIALLFGASPMVVFKLCSVLALVGACVLLYKLGRLWAPPLLAVLPLFFFLSYSGTVVWTMSGLETIVYLFIALAAFSAFFFGFVRNRASSRLYALSGVLVFFAGITRPEGPLLGGVIGAVLLAMLVLRWRTKKRRQHALALITFFLSFALPYIVYTSWRIVYFDSLLPNPLYCKLGGADSSYLFITFLLYVVPFVPFMIAVLWNKKYRPLTIALWAMVTLYGIALFFINPVVGHMNRHAFSAIAAVYLLAVAGFAPLASFIPQRTRGLLLCGLAVTIVVAIVLETPRRYRHIDVYVAAYNQRTDARAAITAWVNDHVPQGGLYAIGDAGYVPAHTGRRVLDLFCLNSAAMTSLPVSKSPAAFADYFFQQRPAAVLLTSVSSGVLQPITSGHAVVQQVIIQDARFKDYDLVRVYPAVEAYAYWLFALQENFDQLE